MKEKEEVMINKWKKKRWGILNCLALLMVFATANSACIWCYHQPDFPKEANFMRKHND